jgi:hypothetical protein
MTLANETIPVTAESDCEPGVTQSGEWPALVLPANDLSPANDAEPLDRLSVEIALPANAPANETTEASATSELTEALAEVTAELHAADAEPANDNPDVETEAAADEPTVNGVVLPSAESVSEHETLPADQLSAHFLSRLERLTGSDLDRAMRLYYHHDELRRVVTSAVENREPPLPEDHDVAVPLDETPDAPRVIVSRTGAFITCLGRGMTFGYVMEVPYAKFEEAMRLRAEIDESYRRRAELRDRFTYSVVVRTIYHMGAYLPREHIDWITAHGEPIGWLLARRIAKEACAVQRLHDRAHIRRERTVELRTEIWRLEWAVYHQILLFGELRALEAWKPLWWMLVHSNCRVRAFSATAVAKMSPRWPTYVRKFFRDPDAHGTSLFAVFLLITACVGLAHPGRKEQCVALLASMVRRKARYPKFARAAEVLLEGMERVRRVPRDEYHFDLPAMPEGLYLDSEWLAFALVAAHRPLRECLEPLASSVTRYREKLEQMRADGDQRWHGPPTRRNEGPVIGRNDPCPCQSGKKHKKCCLGKPAEPAKAEPSPAAAAGEG